MSTPMTSQGEREIHLTEAHKTQDHLELVSFLVTLDCATLEDLVDKYRTRTYVEDVDFLTDVLGGPSELARKLKTDLQKGITIESEDSLAERDEIFGSNKKDPFKRTSKFESNYQVS